ncbi:hypothetical protein BJY01DRAFT_110491 [Aspergillus pseudoustus]|uniref:FHA domain-containing protein n=1 Tax=Aspergillus pseudoustus TaxID=1810923 RepID=A0ABR4ITZ3_9EURO
MESSPPRSNSVAPVAGVKRPASLLPAFEPLSSSPSLPRPQKRVARDDDAVVSTYPTPVPTSSTHIMSSSPPRMALPRNLSRRTTTSAGTERSPLSAVPTLMLSETGEPITMGRSSASCHYQLAPNRMISRIHVKAVYKPAPNPFDRDRVEIVCMGWNGIKLHCQGKTYDLAKGKTFTSDIKDADIMIDVHESRVLVQWPRGDRKEDASTDSEQTWEEATPTRNKQARCSLQDSPSAERKRLASPISPSPAAKSIIPPSSPLFTPTRSRNAVVVYEDEGSPIRRSSSDDMLKSSARVASLLQSSQSSDLSDLSRPDDLSDHDEENDPIIHSFGPFGENLLPRMASFTAESPLRPTRPRSHIPAQPLQPAQSPRQPSKPIEPAEDESIKPLVLDEDGERVQNHAINQLAFSRLSSTPFSTILSNLPPSLWKANNQSRHGPSKGEIRAILDSAKCIGKVAREGKDAAGKALESEYYYIPDFDEDPMRREAVVTDLRKPGLRNCRKQHKQYFWRKPK